MSASDWEEVKRLAADFQRAQLTSSVQRLSERNCIEIINKLIERNEIEVVFTTDGKEYITPDHLIKEIKDELYVHNGRINLVELAKILSVDLNVIISKAAHFEDSSSSTTIVNGQLINQNYINSLCEEINDKLQQQGQIKIADLTSLYDLSSDFLKSIIEKQLGKIIKAKQDKQDHHIFFTEGFIERNKCAVRGALLALTKPVQISTLLNLCNIQERIFLSVIEELNQSKSMPGTITGNIGVSSTYIPSVYIKSQMEWVTNFYEQNGYLEFSALHRLGITDPVSFIKRNLGQNNNNNIVILASCAVGSIIFDQIDAAIDDIISTASFVDIMTLLPTVFEEKDAEVILNSVAKKKLTQYNLHIFNSTVVVTDTYLKKLLKSFDKLTESKAKECVSSGEYIKKFVNLERSSYGRGDDDRHETKADRKEERRRKAAEGKGGGGLQGRETKTKSTKKKYMKNVQGRVDDDDSDTATEKDKKSNQKLEIIEMNDIREILKAVEELEEETEEFIEALAQHFYPIINKIAFEIAKTCYESSIASAHQNMRKRHNDLQQKLNDLVLRIRLFEKGYKLFPSKDVQQQLAKYLLKSICTDVANDIFAFVAQDNTNVEVKEMTTELRAKILNEVPNDIKEPLVLLHKSLVSNSVDDFLNVIDAAVGPGICDVILKKPDKKRERPELLNHRQQLVELLNCTRDPAMVLHLTALIIFQTVTQTILHASSSFASTILKFLHPNLPEDTYNSLQVYHDVVLQWLSSSDEEAKAKAEKILEDEMQSIKDIALSYKKLSEKTKPPIE